MTQRWSPSEKKNVQKGENAGNQHFLLFQLCFLSFPNQISVFDLHLSTATVEG